MGALRNAILGLGLMMLSAACSPAGGIEITEAWGRAANQSENSAVYLVIRNRGPEETLLAASSPAAEQVELHRSIVDQDGVVRMEHQSEVPLPSGDLVRFEPGGLHFMLLDLKQPLPAGSALDLTLIFKNHEPIDITAEIRNP